MSLLETWVRTPFAGALGWTLVHSLWEGAVLALALAAALGVLRSSRARYAAGCFAMIALLVSLAVTFTVERPQRVQSFSMLRTSGLRFTQAGIDDQWIVTKGGTRRTAADYLPWLAPFWIAGVLIFQLRGLASWMAARRLRRTGVCCVTDLWQARLEDLKARLRLSRPVVLLESCLADAPVVIGYLRPVILMPAGLLTSLPAGQIEAILLHELAHIRRHDYLVNLFQVFVEGLLFYHPAVWWISGVIRSERENCCDDVVVAVKGGAFEYVTALAALEESRGWPREALAATGGSLTKRIRRLLVQPERSSRALTPIYAAAILTVTLVTVMAAWQSKPADRSELTLLAATGPAPQAALDKPKQVRRQEESLRALETPYRKWLNAEMLPVMRLAQANPAPNPISRADEELLRAEFVAAQKLINELDSPYKRWLNEDVVYIVTDEEKQAWKRLGGNKEREKFIDQFWSRRNPAPGALENQYKEEHYRRIGYANERFTTGAGFPGWKTDRGRIYITFGPPDELESHYAGDAPSYVPFERWLYRFIDGVGTNVVIEFTDPSKSGEFRMTSDPSGAGFLGVPNPLSALDGLRQLAELRLEQYSNMTPQPKVKAGATVQVMGNSAALISIPLNADRDHLVNLLVKLKKDGRNKMISEQTIKGPAPLYTNFIAVSPGSYQLDVIVRDVTTGRLATDTIEFEVK